MDNENQICEIISKKNKWIIILFIVTKIFIPKLSEFQDLNGK